MTEVEFLAVCLEEGWFAGPDEDFAAFEKRVRAMKEWLADPRPLEKLLKHPIGVEKHHSRLFLCRTGGRKKSWWHGALTWLHPISPHLIVPVLELPAKFRWVGREELLAHEGVHVSRSMFKEPVFEEIIAFRTSEKRWRRLLGPLLSGDMEAGALFIAAAFPPFAVLIGAPFWISHLPWIGLLFGWGVRLFKRQSLFHRAFKRMELFSSRPETAIALLTDREIIGLAGGILPELGTLPRQRQLRLMLDKCREKSG
ncbi:MAG: hypothetical protein A3F09_05065 [Chlamydiae bacterium RIFCSPHIGHO2_12_FULL_49_11]|nr:MAG: hypothetical protein A3F09_05065 [Chlamydiae bacterium RIFCSPHIGHO2_12_FULL_49_11]